MKLDKPYESAYDLKVQSYNLLGKIKDMKRSAVIKNSNTNKLKSADEMRLLYKNDKIAYAKLMEKQSDILMGRVLIVQQAAKKLLDKLDQRRIEQREEIIRQRGYFFQRCILTISIMHRKVLTV